MYSRIATQIRVGKEKIEIDRKSTFVTIMLSIKPEVLFGWEIQTSRRTGRKYYHKNGTSVWHDESLPFGWAFGQDSENGPKYYVHLESGARQNAPPLPHPPSRPQQHNLESSEKSTSIGSNGAAQSSNFSQNGEQRNLKRKRSDSEVSTSRLASAPLPAISGIKVPGHQLPVFPSTELLRESSKMGFPPPPSSSTTTATASSTSTQIDSLFFTPSSASILRQLILAAQARYFEHRSAMKRFFIARGKDKADAEEEANRTPLHIVDCGAGSGASTLHILSASNDAEVYAIDMWHLGESYYADQLSYFGNSEKASSWRTFNQTSSSSSSSSSSTSSTSTSSSVAVGDDALAPVNRFTSFCSLFPVSGPERSRVVPMLFSALSGLAHLQHNEIVPWVLWLDCELLENNLKAILEALWKFGWIDPYADIPSAASRRRNVHPAPVTLVGGGCWAISEGVRSAVTSFAADHGLSLHVEKGEAWTFARDAIIETENDPSNPLHRIGVDEKVAEQVSSFLRVVGHAGESEINSKKLWLAKVLEVIDSGGGVVALREAIGPHKSWIDEGGDDKRHLNALMRAAKMGRCDLVTSLIDEHGANVNAVADRSLYTALILAAYDNHKDVVKILLARGADQSLRNKFGESALQCVLDAKAKGKNRDELLKLLQTT